MNETRTLSRHISQRWQLKTKVCRPSVFLPTNVRTSADLGHPQASGPPPSRTIVTTSAGSDSPSIGQSFKLIDERWNAPTASCDHHDGQTTATGFSKVPT